MRRVATEQEADKLNEEFGSLTESTRKTTIVDDTEFARCEWRDDDCQWCQRKDGVWVLIKCLG